MFRRLLSSIGLAADEVNPDSFTTETLAIFREKAPQIRFEVVAPLELKATLPSGETHSIYLDNLYRRCASDPANRRLEMERFAETMADGVTAEAILPKSIVPVIRDIEFVREYEAMIAGKQTEGAKFQLATEPFGADLFVVYVCDNPKTVQYLSREDIAGVHLAGQTLRELAVSNLAELVIKDLKLKGAGGFFIFSAGGCYEPSLLLAEIIWEKVRVHIKGDVLFGVPSRDGLLVADSAVPEAVAQLAKATKEVFDEAPYRVSPAIYKLQNGAAVAFDPGQQSLAG